MQLLTNWEPQNSLKKTFELLPELDGHDAEAPMLPRACYTSHEFFAFEREAVFARSWLCVGRADEIPNPGDYLAASAAEEPLLIVRGKDRVIRAMSAICQHRGEVMISKSGSDCRLFKCPLHFWAYDLEGKLVAAPRMGDHDAIERLRQTVRLPAVRLELWHDFVFINLDNNAPPLAPSLAKLEPYWKGYEEADLVTVPPLPAEKPVPWNWKVQLENFTDAYHPEFVHRGTHDFAPSNHPDGGVAFTDMNPRDNAIIRTVPLLKADGGMTNEGWGETAMFPAITSLPPEQRSRLCLAMVPPTLQLMFAPGMISYTVLRPIGAEATRSSRVTGGGWILPHSTLSLPDFAERAAAVREGASKILAQDTPVNLAMQAGKHSRFTPDGIYGPLETTLTQFNSWLLHRYRAAR